MAEGGLGWVARELGGKPQESERRTVPEEPFSGVPACRNSDKMADTRHDLPCQPTMRQCSQPTPFGGEEGLAGSWAKALRHAERKR